MDERPMRMVRARIGAPVHRGCCGSRLRAAGAAFPDRA